MYTALIIVIVILIIIIFYKIIRKQYDRFSIRYNVLYPSTMDDQYYYVHERHEDMQNAADMFAEINYIVTIFIDQLYNKYKDSNNSSKRSIAVFLKSRYNANNIRENSPLNVEKDTSYTINKGDLIAMCIRSGMEYNQIHDIDITLFVTLHELTHISISAYDHPDDFWESFKFILIEAENFGLYISPDFATYPVEYCGIKINYNPRYDPFINDI